MSAPVFLLSPPQLAQARPGATIEVDGDEGRHGASVRRLRTGEFVDLVDGSGRRVRGQVSRASAGTFDVTVTAVTDEPRPEVSLTVVQALAKGDRAEAAVEMLTECGVDRIVPWSAARSISRWEGAKASRGPQRWRAVAAAATKQSRRSTVPQVDELADTAEISALLASARLGLVLHESAAARLARLDASTEPGEIVVVVGPEGGIDDAELAQFTQAGALPVRLGDSVLRTSTAGVAAAAVLMAASGRWD